MSGSAGELEKFSRIVENLSGSENSKGYRVIVGNVNIHCYLSKDEANSVAKLINLIHAKALKAEREKSRTELKDKIIQRLAITSRRDRSSLAGLIQIVANVVNGFSL